MFLYVKANTRYYPAYAKCLAGAKVLCTACKRTVMALFKENTYTLGSFLVKWPYKKKLIKKNQKNLTNKIECTNLQWQFDLLP